MEVPPIPGMPAVSFANATLTARAHAALIEEPSPGGGALAAGPHVFCTRARDSRRRQPPARHGSPVRPARPPAAAYHPLLRPRKPDDHTVTGRNAHHAASAAARISGGSARPRLARTRG